MPCVAPLDAFRQAIAGFAVADLGLLIEPEALAAARRSLGFCGLLLVGEVHGVRENPLLIRALMQALELTSVALEWPGDFTSVIGAFLAGGTLEDHWLLGGGDGRITAGHLAVLAGRAAAGPLELILFDGGTGAGWSWSQDDEAMAGRVLAACPAGRASSPGTSARRDRYGFTSRTASSSWTCPRPPRPPYPSVPGPGRASFLPNGPRASHSDGHELTMAR